MTSKSRADSRVVRLLVGSSKAMTFASRENALAISTICRCAMESDPAFARGSISSPKHAELPARAVQKLAAIHPPAPIRQMPEV